MHKSTHYFHSKLIPWAEILVEASWSDLCRLLLYLLDGLWAASLWLCGLCDHEIITGFGPDIIVHSNTDGLVRAARLTNCSCH